MALSNLNTTDYELCFTLEASTGPTDHILPAFEHGLPCLDGNSHLTRLQDWLKFRLLLFALFSNSFLCLADFLVDLLTLLDDIFL